MSVETTAGEGSGKKESRQAFLLRYIQQNHYISIDEITRLFSVTTQTARRDVMALEQLGRVRRLHGGAATITAIDPIALRQRRTENAAQKAKVAAIVADIVPDGAAVFIDTGTTCEAVAQALMSRRDLRVVTYSLRVATILSENSTFSIAVPGGFVRPVDGGVFQEDTADYVRRFKFDLAIISVSGIDDDGDICDDDHAEVAVVSAALAQSGRKILAVELEQVRQACAGQTRLVAGCRYPGHRRSAADSAARKGARQRRRGSYLKLGFGQCLSSVEGVKRHCQQGAVAGTGQPRDCGRAPTFAKSVRNPVPDDWSAPSARCAGSRRSPGQKDAGALPAQ
ncbi:HTH-type transcriptional regulator UlaR [Mycolicibacterium aubagnense]